MKETDTKYVDRADTSVNINSAAAAKIQQFNIWCMKSAFTTQLAHALVSSFNNENHN